MVNLLRRLAYWFRQRRADRELVEEIETHRVLRQKEIEKSGLSPADAEQASRRAMGNVLLARENARSAWISSWLDQLWQDIRYGIRQLRSHPGFTCIAVATLAIGIGANTAVFTIVNGVLLESLPYKHPEQLVMMFERLPGWPEKFGFSPPDFELIRRESRSFSGMAAYRTASYELAGIAQPQRLSGVRVSSELFSVIGVEPFIGRPITSDEDRQQAHVVEISYGLWSREFGRDSSIIGRTIQLDREPYVIIGVMPRSFDFPSRGPKINGDPADVFLPISFSQEDREAWGMRYNNTVVARLGPGVTLDQARAEIASLVKPLIQHYPAMISGFITGLAIPVIPFDEEVVGTSRRMLLMLTAAVAMVLLIGCADVANLILTRSSSRQREMAIRSSLGAGPTRIFRQLLTEGLTLAAAGGALALLLAYGSKRLLLAFAGQTLPRAESISLNYRVAGFTALISLLTPLIFAVLPAFRAARFSDGDALKQSTRNSTPGQGRSRLLGIFLVAQVALALILSIGAGLLVRSFTRLMSTEPGFRPEQVIHIAITLPSGSYATGQAIKSFYREAVETMQRIPGVSTAGAGTDLPLSVRDRRTFTGEGTTRQIPASSRTIATTWASAGYLETLGIPIKRGRSLTDADTQSSPPVVIINEAVAQMLWPGTDPVGHRMKWGIDASETPWMTIIGVAGDVKQSTLDVPTIPQAYVPAFQEGDAAFTGFNRTVHVVVRSSRDADSLIPELRTSIRQMDPELPVKAQTLTDVIGASLQPQRFSMSIVMLFAVIALGLSAIGIYGVLSNIVSQQTQEIGVRIALGATAGSVIWIVLRRALKFMTIGLGIGIIGAYGLTRLMAGLLYEVSPTDAVAFLGAAVALTLLAVAASLVPAWRAARIDPLTALKLE
ncbi:MAG TPA: ABC transporter permease [Terriglobia bacterium]|jgi:predicted permease